MPVTNLQPRVYVIEQLGFIARDKRGVFDNYHIGSLEVGAVDPGGDLEDIVNPLGFPFCKP